MSSTRCSACGADAPAASRFCNSCGANLAASAVVTDDRGVRLPWPEQGRGQPDSLRGVRLQADGGYPAKAGLHDPAAAGLHSGRFPVGIVLGERYRILGLLGRGGMGEVYRAHDLKLEQQVALKFLPEAAAYNPSLMERFRGEVRIARQISHRNVCRVYDLGEVNGAAFISMEYVDGEDLASLLRRIGRLPGDKALEFARRLCAGLAAAHEKGVLHRDLKPANIMIDGRGQLLIMDFGLAAVADAITGHDIRSGTPAYMSPEQKEGRDVTVRSDIYALGLVLAEMFSGSRPTADGTLTSTSKDVDPAIEKVIQRCVDPNPAKRFASALDVARALPGGDPLAEALAAGETPSPQMVAASEDAGVLSVAGAVALLTFVVAGFAVLTFWGSRYSIVNSTPLPYSPDVLEQKAREMIAALGYVAPQVDRVRDLRLNGRYLEWAQSRGNNDELRRELRAGEPGAFIFDFFQSPAFIVPRNPGGQVLPDDPDRLPGSVELILDSQARLLSFWAVPSSDAQSTGGSPDWNTVFETAGLDASRWTPTEPRDIPKVAFDERKAWTGSYPGAPDVPLRMEAATWRGRLTSFETFAPWRSQRVVLPAATGGLPGTLFLLIPSLAGVLLALRHLRSGRGDLSGAARIGAFVGATNFLSTLFETHHTPSAGELTKLGDNLSANLLIGGTAWAVYVALEPYVRRHWPQCLIGWTRILGGKVHDATVGSEILAGLAAGLAIFVARAAGSVRTGLPYGQGALVEMNDVIGLVFGSLSFPPFGALFSFLGFILLRGLFRRTWIIVGAIVTLFVLVGWRTGAASGPFLQFLQLSIAVAVASRFGLLALAAMFFAGSIGSLPLTPDFTAWYAPSGWLGASFFLAAAVWSFSAALGGRRVWKGDLLDV
jgi:serine/threonine-protein kinase